jgi:hypothetical protein
MKDISLIALLFLDVVILLSIMKVDRKRRSQIVVTPGILRYAFGVELFVLSLKSFSLNIVWALEMLSLMSFTFAMIGEFSWKLLLLPFAMYVLRPLHWLGLCCVRFWR